MLEYLAVFGVGAVLVEVVRVIASRRTSSASAIKTQAEADGAEASAGQSVVDAAKDVVTLLREDNSQVRDELREERRQRLQMSEAARAREKGLVERISALEVRLASADQHAKEVARLRTELAVAVDTIRRLEADLAAIGAQRRQTTVILPDDVTTDDA